jgi:hypothetical protein
VVGVFTAPLIQLVLPGWCGENTDQRLKVLVALPKSSPTACALALAVAQGEAFKEIPDKIAF